MILKYQLFLHYYTDWKLKIRYQLVTLSPVKFQRSNWISFWILFGQTKTVYWPPLFDVTVPSS